MKRHKWVGLPLAQAQFATPPIDSPQPLFWRKVELEARAGASGMLGWAVEAWSGDKRYMKRVTTWLDELTEVARGFRINERANRNSI